MKKNSIYSNYINKGNLSVVQTWPEYLGYLNYICTKRDEPLFHNLSKNIIKEGDAFVFAVQNLFKQLLNKLFIFVEFIRLSLFPMDIMLEIPDKPFQSFSMNF